MGRDFLYKGVDEATGGGGMRYEIMGTTMQALNIALDPGEQVYSQTNTMAWMSPNIEMATHTGGGLFAGLKRTLGGGSLFVTDFTARQAGQVAFAPRFPGTIVALRLGAGQSLICRKETFLCAEKSVLLEIAWQRRLGAGFFGGEGFVLQKVTGPGTVFLDLSGEVVERQLGAGEQLLVHAGHVGVIDPSVTFDIKMVRGFRNLLFGGEGLFLASLTGPGRVMLQTMPIINLAEEIARYLPGHEATSAGSGAAAGGAVAGIGGSIAGAILGGLMGQRSNDS